MTDARKIDMHVHSSASDGTFSPSALLAEAKKAGLSAMALTDHDTMDGISEAETAAKELGIELVPGVELSTEYAGCEIHVLGYYVSPEYPKLKAMLEEFREFRDTRNVRMVERLQEEGFAITMEQLADQFPDPCAYCKIFMRDRADCGCKDCICRIPGGKLPLLY